MEEPTRRPHLIVSVSGAAGRMGRLVAESLDQQEDLALGALYAPGHAGEMVAGRRLTEDRSEVSGSDVVVEFSPPEAVDGNLRHWNELGVHAVVGTSGFDEDRLAELRSWWGEGPPNCLVVPNFSLGAVLMMHFAEQASGHFSSAEVVELHHEGKRDAPSGTALATAARMAGTKGSGGAEGPARGMEVGAVRIHSVRLPGLLAHQEVILGSPGEVLSIRHDTTDRSAFLPGVLLAVRGVTGLNGVRVGLEAVL